ncbi:hypothetical protein K525DRAFT_258045 [Schizophyllum commune Loenen D]|nr:hypothetical protein K525DRAFT_258045 [Schizophyllum commune Loenen D]
MAQAATMGPPLSPREPRRSGRRSLPAASTSTSKSPESDHPSTRPSQPAARPPLSTQSSNGRTKRPKLEDTDDSLDDRRSAPAAPNGSSTSTNGSNGSRSKRKTKDKEKPLDPPPVVADVAPAATEDTSMDPPDGDDQGVTRCVCGSTEDDPDAGEFMVQCEICNVWQHGLCMGFESEDQLHESDYFCEKCRPDLHEETLRKLNNKRSRGHNNNNNHHFATHNSRTSRSRSPSLLTKQQHAQPSKRRNTMNSRDADFDHDLEAIIRASAAEAAAQENAHANEAPVHSVEQEVDADVVGNARKKRRRTDDDALQPKKRTRSASTTSDMPVAPAAVARDETPVPNNRSLPPVPPAPKTNGRQKRGARKPAVNQEPLIAVDGEEVPTPSVNQRRKKGGQHPRRPGGQNASAAGDSRRQSSTVNGHGGGEGRAYRQSHAFAVSQQPLYTSWGLPDYLAHLEEALPTVAPVPLEVRAGGSGAGSRGGSMERTIERGVKVKWPSKRMSVTDMNKRVRSLVEWVSREQASAADRQRRRESLEMALKEERQRSQPATNGNGAEEPMVDGAPTVDSPMQERTLEGALNAQAAAPAESSSSDTMKQMEELMEELIKFQERYGPGAKARERRAAAAAAAA